MNRVLVSLAWVFLVIACQHRDKTDVAVVEEVSVVDLTNVGAATLSSYGFYSGELRNLSPSPGVIPYSINSPLFSDYAFKKRMVRIPEGSKVTYDSTEVFDFPKGTVLIKNFYYPSDMRKPEEKLRLLETRLLILKENGWEPLTYVWNDDQTEAFLEVAGKSIPISWIHTDGVLRTIDYSVPNLNQCKGCHLKGEKVMPIGPTARQLNRDNQLTEWHKDGFLAGLSQGVTIPRLASYEDSTAPVADRARAWLEVNCAHCHRPDGPAKNSGLHLAASIAAPMALGIGKAPVAAGKGSGGRLYSIVPGKPDESILLYRIESVDPGVMMPEMGRRLAHKEGVELVRQWILEMK